MNFVPRSQEIEYQRVYKRILRGNEEIENSIKIYLKSILVWKYIKDIFESQCKKYIESIKENIWVY